jgi:hypothetical protein
MGHALPRTVQLVDEDCVTCGTPFAWPKALYDARQRDGHSFYCPNGHSMCYGPGEAARLRKLLDEANNRNTQLAQQVRDAQIGEQDALGVALRAEKEAKRVRRRLQAGVCSCCNRTFQNLARHMATKHPA